MLLMSILNRTLKILHLEVCKSQEMISGTKRPNTSSVTKVKVWVLAIALLTTLDVSSLSRL